MLRKTALSFSLSLTPLASSTILYAASYSGLVTTLNLTLPPGGCSSPPLATSLSAVSETDACGGSPAWLELDPGTGVLYCSDEGLTGATGSVASFATGAGGVLELLHRLDMPQGPVGSVRYGDGGLAVAHYATSMVTLLNASDPTTLSPPQTLAFELPAPGADPARQDAPHPHQVALDPTGAFLLVPDLGADLVRVLDIAADGLSVAEMEPLVVAPGSGPRHVAWTERGGAAVMYVITELANTISGYEVGYPEAGGLAFEELFTIPTHGEGEEVPEGAAAAEILLSPDGNFLTISSRNESAYTIPNPVPPGDGDDDEGDVPSDTLVTFSVGASGELTLLQKAPAGGLGPRQFAFNRAGDLVAVGLQADSRVVVARRDVETGEIGGVVAGWEADGGVTCVIFDE